MPDINGRTVRRYSMHVLALTLTVSLSALSPAMVQAFRLSLDAAPVKEIQSEEAPGKAVSLPESREMSFLALPPEPEASRVYASSFSLDSPSAQAHPVVKAPAAQTLPLASSGQSAQKASDKISEKISPENVSLENGSRKNVSMEDSFVLLSAFLEGKSGHDKKDAQSKKNSKHDQSAPLDPNNQNDATHASIEEAASDAALDMQKPLVENPENLQLKALPLQVSDPLKTNGNGKLSPSSASLRLELEDVSVVLKDSGKTEGVRKSTSLVLTARDLALLEKENAQKKAQEKQNASRENVRQAHRSAPVPLSPVLRDTDLKPTVTELLKAQAESRKQAEEKRKAVQAAEKAKAEQLKAEKALKKAAKLKKNAKRIATQNRNDKKAQHAVEQKPLVMFPSELTSAAALLEPEQAQNSLPVRPFDKMHSAIAASEKPQSTAHRAAFVPVSDVSDSPSADPLRAQDALAQDAEIPALRPAVAYPVSPTSPMRVLEPETLDLSDRAVSPTQESAASAPEKSKNKVKKHVDQTSSERLSSHSPAQADSDDGFEKPAVHQPTKKWEALSHMLNPFYDENAVKPISYSPLPAIAIFPVLKHGNDKAFGDLPLLFAREYSERMELKTPETRIYNPIYTVDDLRQRGLGHIYDKMMAYYLKAGRPDPTATEYLLKQLSTDGKTISRVVFVEADLDTGRPDAATGLRERMIGLMTDGTPSQMKYFVRSRLQIFDAENPAVPMVWGGSWTRSIKVDRFYNVTPSVYADSDSQQAFARLSREMSREMLYVMPKEAYMIPVYDTSVQGKLAGQGQSPSNELFPNFTESAAAKNRVSEENKQAIQRILQRQNAISP